MSKTRRNNQDYDREVELTKLLNDVLKQITGHQHDFQFANDHLIQLKRVLSGVNGLLTFRTTVLALEWLKLHFSIAEEDFIDILASIRSTSAYANGFDIYIPDYKLVAEVKCYLPINDGEFFGAAQANGILNDAIKLKNSKTGLPSSEEFYKFIFLWEVPTKTEKAIRTMLGKAKMTSTNDARVQRNDIKDFLEYLTTGSTADELSTEKIYLIEV